MNLLKSRWLVVLSLVLPLGLAPAAAHPPGAVPDKVAHRPLASPDRIVLTWKGDPATSQAVTWRTDTSVKRAIAQIAVATPAPGRGDRPGFTDNARTLPATTTRLKTDLGKAHYHAVDFDDLEPATIYAYRVGDGVNWSEWFHFRTASRDPEPFSFIYLGDAHNDIKSLWSRTIRQAFSQAPGARFVIHAGDLITTANADAEWGDWFYASGWIFGMLPSIPTPGNHEYFRSRTLTRKISTHWRPQFTLPEHGPEGLEETVYFIDYQGARVVVLNSNEKIRDQVAWLEEALRHNPHPWTILTFHHPVFSAARGRDNEELRKAWMPIFDRYRVDLVLQGHDHTYGRTRNVREGISVRNDESGTVYVVSVSGPKMYENSGHPLMQRIGEDIQLYQIIAVDNDTLSYRSYTVTGELYDAFELIKQEGGANQLVEKMPADAPKGRRTTSP